ncbi:hypothetical protein [Rhodococcus chondri]|uniref:Secreted protein n=1 Tax=Rhodococcus chondri TaxID=3065941 RepID=A0ABU7JX36_9NOCA|nr:hypothetical protein [Rhodococcus sp. CC-R104]MEE2034079.1 hypothetical protein [Rhodococcus sp. CC-R104]
MTRRTTRHRMRHFTAAATLTVAAGLTLPAVALAQPLPAEPPAVEAPAVETPAPSPLPAILDALHADPGADQVAVAAARAIMDARGSLVDVAESTPLSTYQDGIEFLRTLGVEPFLYPTGAPFCTDDSSLPLGIAPAVAGALPGPWPDRDVLGRKLNIVDPGNTLFAFVPVGLEDDANADGIQLAWFNINSLRGGFVPMGTIEDAANQAVPAGLPPAAEPFVKNAISSFIADTVPFGGVRVAPVDTGSGTVLAAVFGTVQNGEKSCFFLPTIGVVEVPA